MFSLRNLIVSQPDVSSSQKQRGLCTELMLPRCLKDFQAAFLNGCVKRRWFPQYSRPHMATSCALCVQQSHFWSEKCLHIGLFNEKNYKTLTELLYFFIFCVVMTTFPTAVSKFKNKPWIPDINNLDLVAF